MSDKFTTAKSEFSYMSSERQPGSPEVSSNSKNGKDSNPSSPALRDVGEEHFQNGNNSSDHQNGCHSNGSSSKTPSSDSDQEQHAKKPKRESRCDSYCDTDSDLGEDLGKVPHILGGDEYPSPFPSPDHNYAISPVKLEARSEEDDEEDDAPLRQRMKRVKQETEVKQEPKEVNETPSRYRVNIYFQIY